MKAQCRNNVKFLLTSLFWKKTLKLKTKLPGKTIFCQPFNHIQVLTVLLSRNWILFVSIFLVWVSITHDWFWLTYYQEIAYYLFEFFWFLSQSLMIDFDTLLIIEKNYILFVSIFWFGSQSLMIVFTTWLLT